MPRNVSLQSSSTQSNSSTFRPPVRNIRSGAIKPVMGPIADKSNDINRMTPSVSQQDFKPMVPGTSSSGKSSVTGGRAATSEY
jgi:hypothetical protein